MLYGRVFVWSETHLTNKIELFKVGNDKAHFLQYGIFGIFFEYIRVDKNSGNINLASCITKLLYKHFCVVYTSALLMPSH